MEIVVLGSFMMDLVVHTPRAPQEGETVIGTSFNRHPGGKGANQAVATSRLGGKTMFIGKLGEDLFGKEAIEVLRNENINVDHVLFDSDNSTGVGHVTIEENGENRITIVPGSNMTYTIDNLEGVKEFIKNAKVLILQLEMDIKLIEQAVVYAHSCGVPIILNPAPANKLNSNILSKVDYLTPNESEVELLTGIKINNKDDVVEAGKMLLNLGVKNVIVTIGKEGAIIVNNEMIRHVPGFKVNPIDTVAAGDAFNGALAYGLINDKSVVEMVEYANAVGALTTTKNGAIPSIPTKEEVEQFITEVRIIQ